MEEKLIEFKKNILLWYPFKKDSSILNLGEDIENTLGELDVHFSKISNKIEQDEKYDYVTIFGKYTYEFKDKLRDAKNFLKSNGKILIALDNKFGLRSFNETSTLDKNASENELKVIFKDSGFENYKFYYVLSNYREVNLIYSEDYKLTEEDITRNFAVYPKGASISVNENEVYKKLLKEGIINRFINSFFIEVSNAKIDTDVKYVTFSNYRKPEYRTMTIIKKDSVVKKAADRRAKDHIKNIAHNLKELKNLDVKVIEKEVSSEIVSDFDKNIRFDEELAKSTSIDDFMNRFEILKKILTSNLVPYSEVKDSDDLKESIKSYDKEKLEKLHFVKRAFIDLVPKNIFFANGIMSRKLEVFDQEWIENNIPVEYIYYRCILNTQVALNKFGTEALINKFGIADYIDLFEDIEKELKDRVVDYDLLDIFFRQYIEREQAERQRLIFRKEAFELQERVRILEEQNRGLNLEIEDAREKLVDYANQLRVISNSSSWKLIQKIRAFIGFFRFRGVSLYDKFYPVGSKRRQKKDEKKALKAEEERIKKIKDSTDEATFNYWVELEDIYKSKIEKRNELVLEADSDPYDFWIKANEPSLEELKTQEAQSDSFSIKPKISIVIPLYNTDTKFFRELLYTLHFQTYKNWELCLADGSKEKLTEIESMCSKDPRIKYSFIGENKGISGNTNEALKLATGDYIGLLDHDDLLPLNALFEVVKAINENPEIEYIYTDEDKIEDVKSKRYDPHFKPDYAPDFLMSGNYICHFSVFKKELMDKLEGFRSEYDGAQDFDIILRATENVKDIKNIKHIPKILYHWRIHEGSTAANFEVKSYAIEAGEKAIQDHLNRIGSNGIAKRDEKINGFYRVTYPVLDNPKVNIIITNRDDNKYIKNCVKSILEKTNYDNFEIVIIDNNSSNFETLKYYEEVEESPKVKVIRFSEKLEDDNKVNYSKLINRAVSMVDGEYILEVDRHLKIESPDWINILVGFAARKEIGIVGAKVLNTDGTIRHAGIAVGIGEFAKYLYQGTYNGFRVKDKMICNMTALSSLCRMYRKSVFEEVSGMNNEIDFENLNEVDFSLRVREKGYLNIYTPQVELIDYDVFGERENILEEDSFEFNRQLAVFKENWKDEIILDPYQNINFSPASSNCTLRIDKI